MKSYYHSCCRTNSTFVTKTEQDLLPNKTLLTLVHGDGIKPRIKTPGNLGLTVHVLGTVWEMPGVPVPGSLHTHWQPVASWGQWGSAHCWPQRWHGSSRRVSVQQGGERHFSAFMSLPAVYTVYPFIPGMMIVCSLWTKDFSLSASISFNSDNFQPVEAFPSTSLR